MDRCLYWGLPKSLEALGPGGSPPNFAVDSSERIYSGLDGPLLLLRTGRHDKYKIMSEDACY